MSVAGIAREGIGSKSKTPVKKVANPYATRETIESVIVAFILAFLFRAFVAEAFVIPTGSMAPTLMGAHKDTICDHCGALYQSTASFEFDRENTTSLTDRVAVGSSCAMCRATNAFDLRGNEDHVTFSGDRILVSKFDYLFCDPQRWDVLVFKYPVDARMNYIKRLVGLPGEFLHIEGGDVYVRKAESEPWKLARKPPHKALAMLQVVSDTRHQARDLVEKGWPSLWQPQANPQADPKAQAVVPTDSWKIKQSATEWSAQLSKADSAGDVRWLRYYHKFFDKNLWKELTITGKPLPPIDVYSTNLITDYLAYNTTRSAPRSELYDADGNLRKEITSENRALDLVRPRLIKFDGLTGLVQDGLHWVGDLSTEFEVDVQSNQGSVYLDAVEFGIHFTCEFDLASGKASLRATDQGKPLNVFADDASAELVVPTSTGGIRGGRHRLRIANIDDQIMVWVDGSLLAFDHKTEFDSHKFRAAEARRPYWTQPTRWMRRR